MKKLFLIIGISGSGKTTFGKYLNHLIENSIHISFGEHIRNKSNNTDKSKLDEKKLEMVLIEILNYHERNIIIDGFPRDKEGIQVLKKIINSKIIVLESVFELNIDKKLCLERVLKRNRDSQIKKHFENRYQEWISNKEMIHKKLKKLSTSYIIINEINY